MIIDGRFETIVGTVHAGYISAITGVKDYDLPGLSDCVVDDYGDDSLFWASYRDCEEFVASVYEMLLEREKYCDSCRQFYYTVGYLFWIDRNGYPGSFKYDPIMFGEYRNKLYRKAEKFSVVDIEIDQEYKIVKLS